ncbi:MAG: ferritin family protein [Minicystis sp.]
MDLVKMLDRCLAEQWNIGDLRLDAPVPAMSAEREMAFVQCFTDMAGIERLAAALFAEQARRAEDPVLRRIFESFVEDELRHAEAAQKLAERFDVRRLRRYEERPALTRFAASFVDAIRYLPPDIANAYIMVGELILDVALLRSIEDALGDRVTREVMKLINRDESRHIAVDFHMFDHYASDAYAARAAAAPPRPIREQIAGALALGRMFRNARPFFKQVFFDPMALVDPSGRRIKEAVKRLQLVLRRPNARRRPFTRFIGALFTAYDHPAARAVMGPVIVRIVGVEPELLRVQYTERELRRAVAMTVDELTEDALAAKHAR